jgi:hypothetical protein
MALTKCPHCDDQHACHAGDSHRATQATEGILFYIGFRAAKLAERLPVPVRPADIQLPARDILALIQGNKSLDQLIAEVEDEL